MSGLRGYFVTGTDTGVGKTLVSQLLLYRLGREWARVVGFKPVASGCESTPAGWRNADALALRRASTVELPYATTNPYAFAPPIAPHLAAMQAGVSIDLDHIVDCVRRVSADAVVVEGVGGWQVPLTAHATTADLATALGLPVVLVVGLRLGRLNHALLTADAIRARGLQPAGWVANPIDRDFACAEENIASLVARLDMPLLGRLPWVEGEPTAAHADLLDLRTG